MNYNKHNHNTCERETITALQRRKVKRVLIGLLIAAAVLSILVSPVSARGTDNTIILNGDTIYLGEENLDFSDLAVGTSIAYLEEQNGTYKIYLSDGNKGTIPSGAAPGIYYAYDSASQRIETTKINIKSLDPGLLTIWDFQTKNTLSPESIPRSAEIIVTETGGTIIPSELKGDWNSFILKNLDTGIETSTIKNVDGATQSLIGVSNPADKNNSQYAFKAAEQSIVGTADSVRMLMTFKVELNGVKKTVTLPFTVKQSSISLTLTSKEANPGDGIIAEFSAAPYSTYDVTLSEEGDSAPFFDVSETEKIKIIDSWHIQITPDAEGQVNFSIKIPDGAKDGTYTVSANGPEGTKSASFKVKKNKKKIILYDTAELNTGKFTTGDDIYFEGSLTNSPYEMVPIYLYVTGGTNIPENGVNLETGKAVVDGDRDSFTITYYDAIITLKWEYLWNTLGFEQGMYTIHANLVPEGGIAAKNPTSAGYDTHISWDVVLTAQSLQIKGSAGETSVVPGNEISYTYFASGSPGKNMTGGDDKSPHQGHTRIYLFGTNYNYTRLCSFDLVDNADDYGKVIPNHLGDVEFNREFTWNLADGNYYFIIQHPGFDGVFDVIPDKDEGIIHSVTSSGDGKIPLGNLLSENAAYALTNLISKAGHDDLYTITKLTIGNGKISINPVGNIHIGDELSIAGTTNYKDSDTFSLNIRLLNFEPVRNTEAMQMTALRTTPKQDSFEFDKIDTSTWVPGTYMAEVTNINTGCSDSVTFDVTSADIAEDTTETADLEPKSTPLPIDTPTPVTFKPTPTKASSSPISLLTVAAGLAAAWFALRRK